MLSRVAELIERFVVLIGSSTASGVIFAERANTYGLEKSTSRTIIVRDEATIVLTAASVGRSGLIGRRAAVEESYGNVKELFSSCEEADRTRAYQNSGDRRRCTLHCILLGWTSKLGQIAVQADPERKAETDHTPAEQYPPSQLASTEQAAPCHQPRLECRVSVMIRSVSTRDVGAQQVNRT